MKPLLIAMIVLSGCAGIKVKQAAIDLGLCVAGQIPAEVANLEPAVLGIITGGAADWNAQLTALEGLGISALVCTVNRVVNDLKHSVPPPGMHAEINPMVIKAIEHGQSYLLSKGIKVN